MIDHHLVDQLKKLKLGGFTETLELRLSQAQKDELSHTAFLARVNQDEIEHEKSILRAQALNDEKLKNKPAAIIDKMVEGRIEKYYKEVCLLEQPFVKDPDITVGQLVNLAIAKMGEKISVRRFVRYEMGEGLQKKQDNFAEEVAAMGQATK